MTLAHDYSTQFNRQDLHARMAPRRRFPRPTSATTTSTTLETGVEPPQAPPILTYSQFLGTFDDVPPTMGGAFQPSISYRATTTNSYGFDKFGSPDPGPSRAYRGSPRTNGLTSTVVIENGWTAGGFEQEDWMEHGKIEEVEDDIANVSIVEDDDEDDDSFEAPRGKTTAALDLSTNGLGGHEAKLSGVPGGNIRVPLISTPPRYPLHKKLPSIRESPPGSENRSLKAPSTRTATVGMDNYPPDAGLSSQALVLEDPHEVSLIKENLDLINASEENVKVMNKLLFKKRKGKPLPEHINLFAKIQEHLESLQNTLVLRTQIGAEEWSVRSSSWHQKYSKRLLSLRTTLQRLGRIRPLVEAQPLRQRQRQAILVKLEQHEAKLADLASKYSTAFDRLRLRHLHFLLTQSHDQSERLKGQQRLLSRASFERRWKEAKSFRAGLRNDFYDLRQELYNTQRVGRQISAP
ncbi:hypothetical protein BDN70DRAFT_880372 [Pholiota conissans]|uniref:Uncharacterized protein n=1 Tax=Pholiota conissans TaxID=109636 RepID=A0A9P5YZ14_9AGAR|nr:hypothetical protein BDN70DRAFT_880372 [Pholiota conissans]